MRILDKIRKTIDLFLIKHGHDLTGKTWENIDNECKKKGLPNIPEEIREKLAEDAFLCGHYARKLEKIIQFVHNNYGGGSGLRVMRLFIQSYLEHAITDNPARKEFINQLGQVIERKDKLSEEKIEEKHRYIG